MSEIVIVAFDPGRIAGIAVMRMSAFHVTSGEMPWLEGVCYIDQLLQTDPLPMNIRVVGERWDSTGSRKMTPQPDAQEMIGAVRFVTSQRNVTFELQSRSDAKTITDADLKKLGWYKKTKDGHSNDACRHLGHYMRSHYPVEWISLTA